MSKQLYRFIKDLRLPSIDRINQRTGEIISKDHVIDGYYSFIWPDVSPCLLVEMYLFDKSNNVKVNKKDGGTLKNYATSLTHLVRFCYQEKIEFWELTHNHIDIFTYDLCDETDIYNDRIRENNTVKTIIQNCTDFLKWVQDNVVTDRNIIGIDTRSNRYQIKLKQENYTNPKGKKSTHDVFPMRVPRSTKQTARPISSDSIKKLWDALSSSKHSSVVSNKLKGIFSKKQQAEHIEYMYKRRELQLILLEATGLRPQELITIGYSNNIEYLKLSYTELRGKN